MATYITSDCINCGACEPECPNQAISEGPDIYVIDPNLCTECVGFYDHEACQAVCPVECCLPDPSRRERLHVAVSTAGVYRSDDGGASWSTAHRGVRAQFLPDPHPEFGQCVHKVVRHPAHPDRLFLQNHWGLYRSDDAGDSWQDIARGVPSDFGFAMAVHPHEPETVYIVPLESDEFRCTPGGRLRVYRTRDGGRTWRALARGLPQKDAHETVLRDALCTDPLPRAGVYFGTRSGKLYGSHDAGASFFRIADGLPPVLCVRAARVTRVRTLLSLADRRTTRRKTRAQSLRKAA